MISYDELERALTRWKARQAGAPVQDAEDNETPAAGVGSMRPAARDRTGEIDVGDVLETYDET